MWDESIGEMKHVDEVYRAAYLSRNDSQYDWLGQDLRRFEREAAVENDMATRMS
jgi:hypothetical protein